ncbi:MAG: RIP metalloprotease RseP [Anaerolineae bacterium]|nr:RIP metalloprotease RseP [Anaerolineae bacterium]
MTDFLLSNDFITGIIAFLLVLIPAVIIHEIGHFLAAKAVGITILEFGIGMPPRMVKLFTRGGTEYTLNWLPLGGFVRPLGEGVVSQMGEEATEEDREEAKRRGIANAKSVYEARPWERIVFMIAGAMANFLMALALFAVVALIGLPEIVGARAHIVYVAPESSLYAAGLRSGDFIEKIDGENFADTDALFNRMASADAPFQLTVARPEGESTTALTLDVTSLAASGETTETHPIIGFVAPNSPADRAGLQAGDLVLAFNGTPTYVFPDLQAQIADSIGVRSTITLWRDGETIEASLVPRVNPPEGEGAIGIAFSVADTAMLDTTNGLAYTPGPDQQTMQPQPLSVAIPYAFQQFGEVINIIASIPAQVLQGTADPNMLRPIGPVGVSQAGAELLRESVSENRPMIILNFIALVSISLGLTNLLPIPALDGGRILFVLLEIVRGRPISPEREGLVHLVGLALLLSLMVVVLINDIAHPVTDLLR